MSCFFHIVKLFQLFFFKLEKLYFCFQQFVLPWCNKFKLCTPLPVKGPLYLNASNLSVCVFPMLFFLFLCTYNLLLWHSWWCMFGWYVILYCREAKVSFCLYVAGLYGWAWALSSGTGHFNILEYSCTCILVVAI